MAHLAMLKIENDENKIFYSHLVDMLNQIQDLEVNEAEKIEPFRSPILENSEFLDTQKNQREDSVIPSLENFDVLKNAPDHARSQFKLKVSLKGAEE